MRTKATNCQRLLSAISVAAAIVVPFVSSAATPANTTLPPQPRLIVSIVVEGLTADNLALLRPFMVERGFKLLQDKGVTIDDVDFGTPLDGPSATAVLFTGAAPAVSGVAAATVYNRDALRSQSVFFDPSTIGNFTSETLSPAALGVSTVADELRISSGGLGYVYALAPDPAEAIVMAGHAGNSAFWVNDLTGKWATTTFYRDLPTPVQDANHRTPLEARLDTLAWVPVMNVESYPDLPSYKKVYPFRHSFTRGDKNRYTAYKSSAAVNTDITDMALAYLSAMPLGRRDATDMLALQYTLNPYPYGRDGDTRIELMDSYLRLDRDLQRLVDALDRDGGPGLDRTVVMVAGTPLTRRQRRDDEKWNVPYGEFSTRKAVSLLNMYLMAIHGNGQWVSGFHDGQLYLNHNLIKEKDKDLGQMRSESARFLERMSGVSHAYTLEEILAGTASEHPKALRRNTHTPTAGDVTVEVQPGWEEVDDANVSSPSVEPQKVVRSVATTAPAFILAPGIAPREISTPVDARAIAPTVTRLLRIRSPNAASLPPLRL